MSGDIHEFVLEVTENSSVRIHLDVTAVDHPHLGARRYHIRYDERALVLMEYAMRLMRSSFEGQKPTAEPEDIMAMLHATLERQIDTELFYGGHAPTPAESDVRAFKRKGSLWGRRKR